MAKVVIWVEQHRGRRNATHREIRARRSSHWKWNFTLSKKPKAALAAIYDDVGFARSLLSYELPDGRLKLIDGHLRRDFDPDLEVEVEVLDVNEEDARKLLLTIDPLTSLAEQQDQIRQRLMETTPVASEDLELVWRWRQMIACWKLRRTTGRRRGVSRMAPQYDSDYVPG